MRRRKSAAGKKKAKVWFDSLGAASLLIQSGSSGGGRTGEDGGGQGEVGENITHSRPPSRSSPRRFYERDARARRRPQQPPHRPAENAAAARLPASPGGQRRPRIRPRPSWTCLDKLSRFYAHSAAGMAR